MDLFSHDKYLLEMKTLIDLAVDQFKVEQVKLVIYTAGIWTDPNAGISTISFDSLERSNKEVIRSNEWRKKHYDRLVSLGDFEETEGFLPIEGRNYETPNFQLAEFGKIKNKTIPQDWDVISEGECWIYLEPALIEVGNYAFQKFQQLDLHENFELTVNGKNDWYEHKWKK